MTNFVIFDGIKKLSVSFVLSSTFILGSLFGAASYTATTKEEGFMLRRITEFWKDQDYETVKKEIVSFLNDHKSSVFCDQLRGNYGDLLIQEGKYKEALISYNQITHKEVEQSFLLNKMQCFYELEQYDELLSAGQPYLTKMSKEFVDRKDEYYFLMAEGYFRSSLNILAKDKKNTYLNKALPLYEKILNSSFNDSTMFALAEIYRLQSDNSKAQSFFLELAKRHPDRKEELLFHAALAQAEFDKPLAIETFSRIILLNGEKAKDSALNRLILFFQEERYEEVISNYKEVLSIVDSEKKSTLEYIIARSYFAKKSYDNATKHLEVFIHQNQGTTDEKRNALLMQLSAAQFLKNENLYNNTLEKLKTNFPGDSELSQAVFIHAMMLKELGRAAEAETKLSSLIDNKNSFQNQEILYLEYGLCAYNNDNWDLSRKTLHSFIAKYPESSHSSIAWKYLLSSSLNLLKANTQNTNGSYGKKEFLADLNKIMLHKDVLDDGEKMECLFLQGKLSYELAKYEEALTHLGKFIYDHFQNDHIAEAHLLTALCHHKIGGNNDLFCTHAEKALSLDPTLSKKSTLHLELFNVYLDIAKASNHSEALTKKARDHLYTALSLGESNIKLENKLWLANSYIAELFDKNHIFLEDGDMPQNKDLFNRSFSLLEEILIDPSTEKLAEIDKETIFLEWEVLKYANLLGRKKEYTKKINVLKSLIEKQSLRKNWGWKGQQEALYELAKTYESKGDEVAALETYNFLSSLQSKNKTFLEEYSKLGALRLNFKHLNSKQKDENNRTVFEILSNLKDIQIRKSPSSEPLHLEAALEYAKIRALITNDQSPHIKYLFFLGRIREDFNNSRDPMVEKYIVETDQNQESHNLFTQYMKFVDAEALRMEAIIKTKDNHIAISLELFDKSKQLLQSIKKETTSVYLSKRIDESLSLIKKGSFF
jgi:hypothetical protein